MACMGRSPKHTSRQTTELPGPYKQWAIDVHAKYRGLLRVRPPLRSLGEYCEC